MQQMADNEEVKTEVTPAQQPGESMADYQEQLDASMRQLQVGDLIECTVAGASETEVTVDFGYYAEGIIRALDYSADPAFSIKHDVQAGDKVSAVILRMDDGHGRVLLSRREAEEKLAWQVFETMLSDKTVSEVTVSEAVKGGVVAYLNGVRAFIPASQLSLSYVEDLSSFKGQTLPVRVITADKDKNRLVLSAKEVLQERREAERSQFVSNLKVGLVTEGTVDSLQTYGAFVSLGSGVDGLLHISQISSSKRLKHPKEVLSVGDKVKVKVTQIRDGRISLSMKALEEAAAEAVEVEKVVIPKEDELTTSLGSLLKGLKLD